MATVHDVAAYILSKRSRMTAMKLERLVYYAQAWSLVWDDRPLFNETIKAWVSGPVVPELFREHRGQYVVSSWPKGNPDVLTADQKDTVESILLHYGEKASQWLSELTHTETPWIEARKGFGPLEKGGQEITHEAMRTYYGSLLV